MIEDSVLREVRAAREAFARSHGYDVKAMVADLRAMDEVGDWPVVRLIPVPLDRQRPSRPRPPVTGVPKAGSCEGLFVVPDDFKEPHE